MVEGSLDLLTAKVVNLRIRGLSFEKIAQQESLAVADVVSAWKNYVSTRTVMDRTEWWILYQERLEEFLTRLNDRLEILGTSAKADDYKNVLDLFDRIEKLMALNEERKSVAEDELRRITAAQTQVILFAFMQLQKTLLAGIGAAFENGKTIKAIKAEVFDVLDNRLLPAAQEALAQAGHEEEQ
ncbi:MAG: hypothetical protein ACTHJ9_00645 [Rhodanobacter sp.]